MDVCWEGSKEETKRPVLMLLFSATRHLISIHENKIEKTHESYQLRPNSKSSHSRYQTLSPQLSSLRPRSARTGDHRPFWTRYLPRFGRRRRLWWIRNRLCSLFLWRICSSLIIHGWISASAFSLAFSFSSATRWLRQLHE